MWWLFSSVAVADILVPTDAARLGLALVQAQPGETIVLEAGTSDQLPDRFPRLVTLECQSGVTLGQANAVDGSSVEAVVTVRGCDITLQDHRAFLVTTTGALTLEGVSVHRTGGVGSPATGGAIACVQSSLTLTGVAFDGLTADEGGAVHADDCVLTSSSGTWSDNTSTAGGGALKLVNGGRLSSVDDRFEGNTAGGYGGAIDATGTGVEVHLADDLFVHNVAGDHGGAVAVAAGELDVLRGRFCWNRSAPYAGSAVYASSGTPTVVRNSQFVGNRTQEWAALRVNTGSLEADHLTFVANAADSRGAAIGHERAAADTSTLTHDLFVDHVEGGVVVELTGTGPTATASANGAYDNAMPLVNGLGATAIDALTADPLDGRLTDPDCDWLRTVGPAAAAEMGATEGPDAPDLGTPPTDTGGDADTDADTDSDADADSDADTDLDGLRGPAILADPGCGCDTAGTGWPGAVLALALVRRRR